MTRRISLINETDSKSKLNLSRHTQDFSFKCHSKIINYISNNPKSLYLLTNSSLKRLDNNDSNYLSEISRYEETNNCSVLMPIPYKTNRKLKSANEKRELSQAMSSAVALRRIVFANQLKANKKHQFKNTFLKAQGLDSIDGLETHENRMTDSCIAEQFNAKKITSITLIQMAWRKYYQRAILPSIISIQRVYRRFSIKFNANSFVVDNRDAMSFMSFRSKNEVNSIGVQVGIDNKFKRQTSNSNRDEYRDEHIANLVNNEENIKGKVMNKFSIASNHSFYTKSFYIQSKLLMILKYINLIQSRMIIKLYHNRNLNIYGYNTDDSHNRLDKDDHYPQLCINTNQSDPIIVPIIAYSFMTKVCYPENGIIKYKDAIKEKESIQLKNENKILLKMIIIVLTKKIAFQIKSYAFKYLKHINRDDNIGLSLMPKTRNDRVINTNASLSSLFKGNYGESKDFDSSDSCSRKKETVSCAVNTNTHQSQEEKYKRDSITNDNSPIITIKSYFNEDIPGKSSAKKMIPDNYTNNNTHLWNRGPNFENTKSLRKHKGDYTNDYKANENNKKLTAIENNYNENINLIKVVKSKHEITQDADSSLRHKQQKQNIQMKLSKICTANDSFSFLNDSKDISDDLIIDKQPKKPNENLLNIGFESNAIINQSQTQLSKDKVSPPYIIPLDNAKKKNIYQSGSPEKVPFDKRNFYHIMQSLSKDKYGNQDTSNRNDNKSNKQSTAILLRQSNYNQTIN